MNVYYRQLHVPNDWGYVKQHIPGLLRVEDTTGFVAIDTEKDETVAACIMDNWTHTAVHVHWVISNATVLKYGFLEEGFDYVFNVAEREMMIGVMPSHLPKAFKLATHIGFEEVHRIKDGEMFGSDLIVTVLRKENCTRLRDPRPVAVQEEVSHG